MSDIHRRRRILRVSRDLILHHLTEGKHFLHYEVASGAVPRDAEIIGVRLDSFHPATIIEILLEHESFDVVDEGQPWPENVTTVRTIYPDPVPV